MRLVKAEGIVIRSMKMGETSKLVTLFTRELGLLKIIAKGSRSSKSRIGAALEPLTVSRIVYYQKENREIQFLSQAEIVEFFPNLPADLEKWGYASACAELVSRSQIDTEVTPKLYPILLDTIRAMNEPAADARACFGGFQMKLCGVLGLAPNLRRCLNCNSAPPRFMQEIRMQSDAGPTVQIHFDIARGGFMCNNCSPPLEAQQLSGETLRLLADFQSLPAEKLSRCKISPVARREIEAFFRAYFAFHLEEIGGLASLKFVHKIAAPSGK
ncbi:DNA repair protein RecO [candidate division KSB1 bacterium]|nr:DNA repair protein RecO [candidate division KSB1 bacterium]